ncbi:MAG: hypothetical protein ACXVAX_00300 [Pseudobdellovibrio sp.]
MKRIFLTVVIALATAFISAHAFADSSTMPECPLKNLKKNQLRGADGTAYFPKGMGLPAANSDSDPLNVNK